ncbi:DUF6257 family protein [Streptomyces sp. NPDC048629]|uniref:DUF6257 family protein n=1 Tax=Streptomyces sp. NPDC048629 TaxID=3154824 RepID=UPI0034408F4E
MSSRKNDSTPKLTVGEKARVTYLVARMAKRSIASETVHMGDLERRVDRVIDGARRREERNAKKRK